ncbi:hypothetical protein [Geopseudomonas aromaticivorans]
MTDQIAPGKKLFSGDDAWPPIDRPILGADLEEFRKRGHLFLTQMELAFGIPSRKAWYQQISTTLVEGEEKPRSELPVTLPIGMLLRFYAIHPEYLPMWLDVSAEDMRERMGLSPAGFGLATGRQEISVRQWGADRDPHRVVVNLLWIIKTMLDRIEGVFTAEQAENDLADLVNCILREWRVRGETPESRRKSGALSPLHPQVIELMLLLTERTYAAGLGEEVTDDLRQVLADARQARLHQPADGSVTRSERKQATKRVRQRRTAQKAVKSMSDAFSMDGIGELS